MSRLLNMADPDDRSLLRRLQDDRAAAIREIMADEESRTALEMLLRKGWETSAVHGALSAMKRHR